jgi:hypothetical protein
MVSNEGKWNDDNINAGLVNTDSAPVFSDLIEWKGNNGGEQEVTSVETGEVTNVEAR